MFESIYYLLNRWGDWELTWLITCAHQGDFLQAGVTYHRSQVGMIGFAEAPFLIIQPPNSFCGMLFEERERAALWRVVSCKFASQHRLRWLDKVNRSGSNLKMVMSQFQNASNFNNKQANRVQKCSKVFQVSALRSSQLKWKQIISP